MPTGAWCMDKRLMGVAMRGILPEAIRLRPKSPVMGDVLPSIVERDESPWTKEFAYPPGVECYVTAGRKQPLECCNPTSLWVNLRLLNFSDWISHNVGAENEFEQSGRKYAITRG